MSNILLTGGRAPATLELARLFNAAGHRVFMAESLPWHLCRFSRAVIKNFRVPPPNQHPTGYIEALLKIVQHERIDLLIPTCEEIFYIAQARVRLAQYCTVFTEDIDTLDSLHHKWHFIQKARQHGLAVPDTLLFTQPEALSSLVDAGTKFVLKPAYSRSGTRTMLPDQSHDELLQAISERESWIAQTFITGQELCTYSVAHQGQLSAHCCYAAEFTAGRAATIVFKSLRHQATLNWVMQFVEREKFTGQIAFDFIETEAGDLFAIECNPRATSGIHLFGDDDRLDQAFFDRSPTLLQPASKQPAMIALPMLLYQLPTVRSFTDLKRWVTTFFSSRDVLFSCKDPLPWLLQWLSVGHLLYWSARYRVSLLEASTLDIEWNGAYVKNQANPHAGRALYPP